MTTIGIVGAGGIGQAFAGHVARAGYDVVLSNSRGPDSLAETVRQLGQVGEARLLLVSALMVLDDLAEASARGNEPAVRDGLQRLDRLEQDTARAIEGLAQRVEAVAAGLEAP